MKQTTGKFKTWKSQDKSLSLLETDFTMSVLNGLRETKKFDVVFTNLKLVGLGNPKPGIYVAFTAPFLESSKTPCSSQSRLQPLWTSKEIPVIRAYYVSNPKLVASMTLGLFQYNEEGQDILFGKSSSEDLHL